MGEQAGNLLVCSGGTMTPVIRVAQVFVVGGNGGNAAADAIQEECERVGVVCSIVGVPKSIDNDILLIDRCFGEDLSSVMVVGGLALPGCLCSAMEV